MNVPRISKANKCVRAKADKFIVSDILINGQIVFSKFDVTAAVGGANKAMDLVFKKISPAHGVIEVQFKGCLIGQALG
jgi:hypothetical protein